MSETPMMAHAYLKRRAQIPTGAQGGVKKKEATVIKVTRDEWGRDCRYYYRGIIE